MGPVLSCKHFIFWDQSLCHTRGAVAELHSRQLNNKPVAIMLKIKSSNQCWCLITRQSGDRWKTTQVAECNSTDRSETSNYTPYIFKMNRPEAVTTHLHVAEDSPGPGRMRERCVEEKFLWFLHHSMNWSMEVSRSSKQAAITVVASHLSSRILKAVLQLLLRDMTSRAWYMWNMVMIEIWSIIFWGFFIGSKSHKKNKIM